MPISNVPPSGEAEARRMAAEKNRAKLRARTKFDDQNMVDKVYRWAKRVEYEASHYPQHVQNWLGP